MKSFTLKTTALFFAVAILTHVLILWAFNFHQDLFTGLILIIDATIAGLAAGIYFIEQTIDL